MRGTLVGGAPLLAWALRPRQVCLHLHVLRLLHKLISIDFSVTLSSFSSFSSDSIVSIDLSSNLLILSAGGSALVGNLSSEI